MTKVIGSIGRTSRATVPVRYPVVWKRLPNRFEMPRSTGQQANFVAQNGLSLVAPGDNARGALHRNLPEALQVTVRYSDRYPIRCPYHSGMEIKLHRYGSRSRIWCRFTLQFSGFGVERGVLGEVVSLVGDCRPPPPGNPRRPITPACVDAGWGGRRVKMARAIMGGFCLSSGNPKSGEVLPPGMMQCTFNRHLIKRNLKELNIPQYFKKNRSYFSCVGRKPVLKFKHLHSHLCGQLEVEPPPIAITNVLETRYMICAVLIAEMKNRE